MKHLLPTKSFIKSFLIIAVPVMIQQLVFFIVSLIDTMMVSGMSNEAVSGVYAVNQITFLYFVMAAGLFSGAGIFITQFFGKGDTKHFLQAHKFKIGIALLGIAVLVPAAFLFGDYLIGFYARNDANQAGVIAEARAYAPAIYLSYIPIALTLVYATTFREVRKTHYPLIGSLVALVINIVGNILFIYVWGMGAKGAAIATLIARVAEFITVVILGEKHKLISFKAVITTPRIERLLLDRIIRKTIPFWVNEVFWVTGMVALSLAYAQRENVLSALSVVSTISNIFGILFMGLSIGISVMVGSLLGRGDIEGAKRSAGQLIILGVIVGMVFGFTMAGLSSVIPLAFVEISAAQKVVASQLLLVYGFFVPVFVIAASSFWILRTGGKSRLILLMDSVSMWGLAVPAAWIVALATGAPVIWIYLAVQAVDLLKASFGLALYFKSKWANNLTTEFKNDIDMVV